MPKATHQTLLLCIKNESQTRVQMQAHETKWAYHTTSVQMLLRCAVTMGMLYNARNSQSAQSTNAAPKMTTNAPSIEPLAMPKDEEAAPPAGGASAPPVGEVEGLAVPVADNPVEDEDGPANLVGPVVELMFPLEAVKLALGPMALLLTVLTAPEMVAKLLWTLATSVLTAAAELVAVLTDLLGTTAAAGGPLMATWMRISSHWAPIHSS